MIFKLRNTLKQSLMKVNTWRPSDMKTGMVHEVPCAVCNHVYIGKTGRTQQKRMEEHNHATRSQDMNCSYLKTSTQGELWHCARNTRQKNVWEAMYTYVWGGRNVPVIYVNCGPQLSQLWDPVWRVPIMNMYVCRYMCACTFQFSLWHSWMNVLNEAEDNAGVCAEELAVSTLVVPWLPAINTVDCKRKKYIMILRV